MHRSQAELNTAWATGDREPFVLGMLTVFASLQYPPSNGKPL